MGEFGIRFSSEMYVGKDVVRIKQKAQYIIILYAKNNW